MSCRSYSTAVQFSAYRLNDVSFPTPFQLDSFAIQSPDVLNDPVVVANIESLTDTDSLSSAGRSHKVVLTFKYVPSDMDIEDINSEINALRSGNFHILVTFLGGGTAWIRSTPDSFSFSTNESDNAITCTITIANVSGVQRVL